MGVIAWSEIVCCLRIELIPNADFALFERTIGDTSSDAEDGDNDAPFQAPASPPNLSLLAAIAFATSCAGGRRDDGWNRIDRILSGDERDRAIAEQRATLKSNREFNANSQAQWRENLRLLQPLTKSAR